MNRRIFYFSLLSLSVASCSGIDSKRAIGDFDYAQKSPAQAILVPQGLHQPKKYDDYHISDKINQDGPIGEKMDIRAPSLVLPVAASSRIELTSDKAFIWFDKVLEDKDLTLLVEDAITQQLEADNVAMRDIDGQSKTFESDWYHNEIESGYWLMTKTETTDSMRFRYQLNTKPHGRSVSLSVSVAEYNNTRQSDAKMDPIDQQRAEMAMINMIISQVDYQYRIQQKEDSVKRAGQKIVTVDTNNAGEPSYLVEMVLDPLWSNMPAFFEKHGFTINDMDEDKHIYYVDFVKPDNSLWATIWGDSVPELGLDDAKYQFVLQERGDQSVLTIYDGNGSPLPLELVNEIYAVMDEGLNFRRY